MLVGLGVLDDRAARREAARATAVLQERAERAGQRASREAMTAPVDRSAARTEGLGRDSPPIGLPAASFSAPAAARRRRAPEPTLAALTAPGTGARTGVGPILLLLMAGAGLSMAGAGLRVLSRRSA